MKLLSEQLADLSICAKNTEMLRQRPRRKRMIKSLRALHRRKLLPSKRSKRQTRTSSRLAIRRPLSGME